MNRHFGLFRRLLFELGHSLPALAFAPSRVLFIEHKVPEVDVDAGSRANLDFLKALLALGYKVHFLQTRRKGDPRYDQALRALGIKLSSVPGRHAARWLKRNASAFALIILSRPEIAQEYLPVVQTHSRAKTILFGHDIHFQRLQRQAEIHNNPKFQQQRTELETVERELWRSVDSSIYLSQEEAEEITRLEPEANAKAIIPYCYDDFAFRTKAPPTLDLLFVAGFGHTPNADAAIWFTREVLPLVSAREKRMRLILAGSNPTREVLNLAGEIIKVTGRVSESELADLYRNSRVAVVPLRFGAGVKLKVVEALSLGLPLVTTPVGIQGLEGLASILPATTDAAAMASSILQLLHDDALWLKTSEAQTSYAQAHFSWAAYQARVEALLKTI